MLTDHRPPDGRESVKTFQVSVVCLQSSMFQVSVSHIMHDSHDSSLRKRESACRSNVQSVVHNWELRQ